MFQKFISLLTLAVVTTALGQPSEPATRPSTVGAIASSSIDVVPLEKGASAPKLILKSAQGENYDLNASIAKKPSILIFYRGGWCPICRQELSGLEASIDDFKDAGVQLIAISPDKPEQLANTMANEQLTFTLLSDSDASAIKAFGLAYLASPAQFKTLEEFSGAAHHAIPIPAVYVVGADGLIQFAHYDPNFKDRMSPSEILSHAKPGHAK